MKWQDKFNLDKAGFTSKHRQARKPYYTEVLHGKHNLKGIVYEINTNDFFKLVNLEIPVNEDVLNNVTIQYNNKDFIWNLPYYDINNNSIKGLHRACVCKRKKMTKIPILLVGVDEKQIKDFLKDKKIKAKCVTMAE